MKTATKKMSPPTVKAKAPVKKPAEVVKFKPKSGKREAPDEENVGKALPVESFPDIEDTLTEAAKEYRSLSEDIAALDARRKKLGADIKILLEAEGYDSIYGEDWVAVRVNGGGGRSLSPELLLKNGVTSKQLEKSYVTAEKFTYVQVRARQRK